MKPCPEFEINIENYADLRPSERKEVEIHLSECAACRGYQAIQRELDDWLTAVYANIQPSPIFQNRARIRIESAIEPSRPSALPEVLDFLAWTSVGTAALFLIWRALGTNFRGLAASQPGSWIWPLIGVVALITAITVGLDTFGYFEE